MSEHPPRVTKGGEDGVREELNSLNREANTAHGARHDEIEQRVVELEGELREGTRSVAEEEPFDPHSMASSVSLEEQKNNKEMRRHLATAGIIAPESVPDLDIDIDKARNPLSPFRQMQRDMDELAKGHEAAPEEVEGSVEPVLGHDDENIPTAERSHAELKQDLRAAVEESEGKLYPKAEAIQKPSVEELRAKAEKSKEYLRGRLAEENIKGRLSEQELEASKMGQGLEGKFREWGKWYNKFGWKTKLAVAGGLVGAAAFTSGVAPLIFGLSVTGLIGQRVLGLAGSYVSMDKFLEKREQKKAEKEAAKSKELNFRFGSAKGSIEGDDLEYVTPIGNEEDQPGIESSMRVTSEKATETMSPVRNKGFSETPDMVTVLPSLGGEEKKRFWKLGRQEKAMLMASLYSIGAGFVIGEAVKLASETEVAHTVQHWLGEMLGHHQPAAPAGFVPSKHDLQFPLGHEGMLSGHTMPSVDATAGRGYEQMLFKMGQELHDKFPQGLPKELAGSDAEKLWQAAGQDTGATHEHLQHLVHSLASDTGDNAHGFFHGSVGTSTLIEKGSHLTVGDKGELLFSDSHHANIIHAADDMRSTPAPEAPHSPPPPPPPPAPGSFETFPYDNHLMEQAPAPVETHMPHPVVHEEGILVDSDGNPVTSSDGSVVHTGSHEESQTPVVEHPMSAHVEGSKIVPSIEQAGIFVNTHGISIDANNAALYQLDQPLDGAQLVAYGGTDEDRFKLVQEYLAQTKNKEVTIRWAHSVPSIFGTTTHVENISAVPDTLGGVEVHSYILQPKAPEPDTFTKIVK